MQRRVVITGLGIVSPLGVGVGRNWKMLMDARTAVRYLPPELWEPFGLPVKIGALVPRGPQAEGCFDPDSLKTSSRRMSDFMQYALCAAEQALEDANWKPESLDERERTGVAVASGIGGIQDVYESSLLLEKKQSRRISPFFVPKLLVNLAAGHISMQYRFQGPNHAVATACAAGAHAIGDAMRFIKYGDADVMIAGGAEAALVPISIAGFSRAKALTTDEPERASRPFNHDRNGFVLGEGAGIMVLEELNHALQRKAHIYAEIVGYGLSSDASHITAPPMDGYGAQLCMKRALRDAKLTVDDVDYINAHATSTPLGDLAELRAIETVFEKRTASRNVFVSSTKGSTGHLLGAAGAVESVFTVMALHQNSIPVTVGLSRTDIHTTKSTLIFTREETEKFNVRVAMSNSFGFGGANASLLYKKY